MTNAIITMAGMGRRFLEAGYTVPKYRIVVHGRTLFAWSILSLSHFIRQGASFQFVVRAEDRAKDFIAEEAAALGIAEWKLVELDHLTDGQATSALLAESRIVDPDQPMLVYNIDTFVHPDYLRDTSVRGDGWIPCFPGKGDAWSFAAADDTGRVSEVREKQRISPYATVGLYWFASFALFREAYRAYYDQGGRLEKGERYIAPLYNHLVESGREVYIESIPFEAVIPLGVPEEVDAFSRRTAPAL